MEQVDAVITATIKALAASQGLTYTEVTTQAGIKQATASRRKSEGRWTATEVAKIALRLGHPVSDLYTGLDGRLHIPSGD